MLKIKLDFSSEDVSKIVSVSVCLCDKSRADGHKPLKLSTQGPWPKAFLRLLLVRIRDP